MVLNNNVDKSHLGKFLHYRLQSSHLQEITIQGLGP